jgi:hypothetical protein
MSNKSGKNKNSNVHLDGAKESGNMMRDNREVVKSAKETLKRGQANNTGDQS